MIDLRNKALLQHGVFINNEFKSASKTFEVRNPWDNSTIAEVSDGDEAAIQLAIESASTAFESWSKRTASSRQKYLLRWHDLIFENQADLAKILTVEMGKPLAEAIGEVKYGASFIQWFAEEGRRAYGETIPPHTRNHRLFTIKQPVGVVAAITPWNFPNAMITRKIAPAIAAGCTVVLKPSEETPLSALALAYLAKEAGIPAGVLNIIPTLSADTFGKIVCKSKVVKKLSFTGSTPVGKQLMAQSAETVKKISLELGGNAPFIIFDDADLDKTVQSAIASKFRNAGQTCICANRFFVHESIAKAFIQKMKTAVEGLSLGNGLEPGVQVGPLINAKGLEKVELLLVDAVSNGAELITGGKRLANNMFEPTIIRNLTSQMDIFNTEIFGPIIAVYTFEEEAEAIKLANNTPYGLACYLFTEQNNRVWRVAEQLNYGMVGVNTGSISTAVAPFGGFNESGIGKEGASYGLEEYLETKYLSMDIS